MIWFFLFRICESYTPNGECEDFLLIYDHPVKFALTPSSGHNFSYYEMTANNFIREARKVPIIHSHCLETLKPFICRYVFFPTCDPAFSVPEEQNICRRACEILTIFVCPEAWTLYLEQIDIINVPKGIHSTCDNLMYANGGDIPDCIDPLDGGECI